MHCCQPPTARRHAVCAEHQASNLMQCMHPPLPQPSQAGHDLLLRGAPDWLSLWRDVHAVGRWFRPGAHAVVSAAVACRRRLPPLPAAAPSKLPVYRGVLFHPSAAAARRCRTGTCPRTSPTSTPAPTTSWCRTTPTKRCPPPVRAGRAMPACAGRRCAGGGCMVAGTSMICKISGHFRCSCVVAHNRLLTAPPTGRD